MSPQNQNCKLFEILVCYEEVLDNNFGSVSTLPVWRGIYWGVCTTLRNIYDA